MLESSFVLESLTLRKPSDYIGGSMSRWYCARTVASPSALTLSLQTIVHEQ